MDNEEVFNQLVEVYNNNDIDLFNKLNEEHMLELDSIEEIADIEDREVLDLDDDYSYVKNYTYSRSIIDLADYEKHLHSLDLMDIHVRSYSLVIFNVILGLQVTSNLDLVLDMLDLNMPKDMAKDFLISNGLVEKGGSNNRKLRKTFKKYDLNELKDELALRSLSTDGNKNALVNRLVNYESENSYVVTDYGIHRFMGVNWVAFYNALLAYFDFDDYEYYMTEYDTGSVLENSLNYLDENIKKGYDEEDFNRLHDAFSSLALININEEDYENALFNELKVFILKLNPVFLDNEELKDYIPIHHSNINNIDALSALAEIDDLKAIFNDAWDDIKFDKKLTSKEDSYNYLNQALNEDIDELNDKITLIV
ncbi:MAG: SAP domain-containing protein [Methanobrevibacter sp.]|uniref:SAP domain-containing protein n=1 Tax=Methanobrevibacter sp. TaxID=66852 RepID=UPI0025E007A2|nr:SAP domain-containing protein [Methanobrevibacter sp.]MBR0271188.1 SAP domain-containing protein [Methanobrevibacter sp.]